MEYKVLPIRFEFFIPICLALLLAAFYDIFGRTILLYVLMLLLTIGLASFSYKLTIHKDHLTYHVVFFKKTIITRELYPSQLKELKFFRVGWSKKAVRIRVNKGMNIRLTVLEKQEFYNHLIQFAQSQHIEVQKTKDYLILERWFSN